jgi:Type VI secretion, TssG
MEKQSIINRLFQEINNNCIDINAETLLAFAAENGLSDDDFVIACNGYFYREYSKDVLASEIIEDARHNDYLQLNLSRCGIFDQLPQGLFFQPGTSGQLTAAEMAAEYKVNKQKEEDIRNFFMPFENEFMWQRIKIESEEISFLQGLQADILRGFFTRFWDFSSSIQTHMVNGLISLLPYVHKIAGSLEIIAKCLSHLLQEQVAAKTVISKIMHLQNENILQLNQVQLGMNMICGMQFNEEQPIIELTIGPLNNSQIIEYLPGGSKADFINSFLSFFIPVGIDRTIKIEQKNKEMLLQLEEEPVLGYCILNGEECYT